MASATSSNPTWSFVKGVAVTGVALAAALAATVLEAQEMPVPASLQTAMFKKIFAYDRSLTDKGLAVLVVHSDKSSELEKIVKSFAEVGISAIAVRSDELAGKIRTAPVVYVLPGTNVASVKQLCAENSVLSISGLPSLVEGGDVSVGLGTEDGKPRIIVNLNRAKLENHQFSSDLLKLSKVVQ